MEKRLSEINKNLEERRKNLSAKIDLRNEVVRTYYRRNTINPLEFFFLSLNEGSREEGLSGFQRVSQAFVAHRILAQNTLSTIGILNKEISEYEADKKEAEGIRSSLDSQKQKLSQLKVTLAVEREEVQKEINSLDSEIDKVNNTLAELSSKQQSLLREKFRATEESTTVGDDEQASSSLPSPLFKPAYAFFTYGYPHRVGANQYGMYGRAKAGHDYKEIIKAYFKEVEIGGSCDKGKTIPVVGYGNLKLEETYMLGIAEVPESWGSKGGYEALKAQAVLARTYALNYTGYYWDSKSQGLKKRSGQAAICTTQACQVYSGRKKTGLWKKAVEETCGVTVKYNGNPITAWYASTSGGFTRTSQQVWGSSRPWTKAIRDASCSGDLFDCAYDGPKHGKSPWFHKAWGINKSTGNAWMKSSEVEDIFNAYLLSQKNSSNNKYLSSPDEGGWSADKVKDKLEEAGVQPVGKIKSVSMKDDGTGFTTSVVLSSDNYSGESFDGVKFKSIFNLRSPGTLVIWTSFYDILIEE
ncbi:SpoIID/LytB domain-containing protein [candidate division WWE3 bacterium]|nr:SpoIID/LytB domain-containing protein [candidate division WWE3 bacterium]